jgi:hypothetical protein
MPFSVPKLTPSGRIQRDVKGVLAPGGRCLVCFETDPAKYANCPKPDCYPIHAEEYKAPTGFKPARPLVSAFELARSMRARALRLDWEQDEERERLLKRARELERGDHAEVPDEDF